MHTLRITRGIVLVVFAFVSIPTLAAEFVAEDLNAKVAVEAFLHNRDSFRFVKCEYTETRTQARSAEDAIAGRFVSANAIIVDYVFVMDGDKVKLDGKAREKPAEKDPATSFAREANGLVSTTKAQGSNVYISDGRNRLGYEPDSGSAGVYPPKVPHLGTAATILGLGDATEGYRGGPDYFLGRCKRGESKVSVDEVREQDGHRILPVTFTNSKYEDRLMRGYDFDVERGFLPTKITSHEVKKNRIYGWTFLTEAKRCSHDRWFPMRTVQFEPREGSDLGFVREIKVTSLDVDNRPSADDFAISLAAGTRLTEQDTLWGFRLKQEERVTPEDLPRLLKMCVEIPKTPLADTAISRPVSWWAWWPMILGVLIVGAVATWLLARFRTRRPQPA